MNSNTLLYYNRVVPLSKSSLCYIVSDRQAPNIPAPGILPAITNGRTKKCLPSGEPVSRKRKTLSRMSGHECDREERQIGKRRGRLFIGDVCPSSHRGDQALPCRRFHRFRRARSALRWRSIGCRSSPPRSTARCECRQALPYSLAL
jgi:hypothetical protein